MQHARVPVTGLTGVSETLLIPLIARAQARTRFPDLGFADPAAERVLSQLDVDPHRFAQHIPTMRGAIIRAQAFDRIAAAFTAAHPGGLAVSLGAGLDTRAERVADRQLAWADIDLPAVADLRGRLLPGTPGHRLIAGSVTDPAWARQTGWEPGQPVLLIAEAVLIFLGPAEAYAFLTRLPGQFPTGAQIALDYGSPLMIRNASRHPGLKNTDARFQWSARGARQIARLHPRLRVLADRNLSGSAVAPGRQGRVLAATSRTLRLATGGWLYGLAHLAISPAADTPSDVGRQPGASGD
jgi:O-methyltransferase involved in polyketide biosynthesis